MKRTFKNLIVPSLALGVLLAGGLRSDADITVTVGDETAPWLGFMNVFNLPADGGAFQFDSGWGTPDLVSAWAGPVLTLSPNTIGDPDPYWYIGGGAPGSPGNKIMEANLYLEETGPLAGQVVTFTGLVLSNTFTPAHSTKAFIKDFAPDYSSFTVSEIVLTGSGPFSIDLPTINDPTRHVQYGFTTTGENVWITDVAPFGSIDIVGTAVPEPTVAALVLLGVALIGIRRRS